MSTCHVVQRVGREELGKFNEVSTCPQPAKCCFLFATFSEQEGYQVLFLDLMQCLSMAWKHSLTFYDGRCIPGVLKSACWSQEVLPPTLPLQIFLRAN